VKAERRSRLPSIVSFALAAVLAAGGALAADTFVRGDVDQSSRLDVSDAVSILRFLFAGEAGLVTCEDAADADDSGALDASDPVFLLDALFRGGAAPAAPFPACGEDSTADALGCEAYEVCRFAFTFFGRSFAADGVFFVLDRSGTMIDRGELPRAKEEISGFLEAAPAGIRFGIVVFDAGVIKFPPSGTAVEATPEMRQAARAFVESVTGGAGTCVHSGLLAGVDFARASGIGRSAIIYVGDGGATCPRDTVEYWQETLDAVTEANRGIARIHAMGLDVASYFERFLRELASRNGGSYTRVR
jgi:hypothetical protein